MVPPRPEAPDPCWPHAATAAASALPGIAVGMLEVVVSSRAVLIAGLWAEILAGWLVGGWRCYIVPCWPHATLDRHCGRTNSNSRRTNLRPADHSCSTHHLSPAIRCHCGHPALPNHGSATAEHLRPVCGGAHRGESMIRSWGRSCPLRHCRCRSRRRGKPK